DDTPLPKPSIDDIPLPKQSIDDIPLPKQSIDDIPLPKLSIDNINLSQSSIDDKPLSEPTVNDTQLSSQCIENTPLPPSPVDDTFLPPPTEIKGEELPSPPGLIDPDDIPIPKSKGYNLDFLENLDDPNYNPFETKTGVRTSPPHSPKGGRKLPPLKPAVKKKKVPPKVNSSTEGLTNSQDVPDIAIPVEQKSEVSEKEALNNIKNNNSNNSTNTNDNQSLNIDVNESIKSEDDNHVLEINFGDSPKKKPPPKKLGQKPKSSPAKKTPVKKPAVETNNNIIEDIKYDTEEEISVPKKGYNLDFLDNLDDPNFNPFETKTAIVNKFTANEKSSTKKSVKNDVTEPKNEDILDSEEKPKPKAVAPKKTPTKKGISVKKQPKAKVESKDSSVENLPENTSNDDLPELPKKGYNLDFLDNLDDPNFNPFESRTTVNNLEPLATSTPSKDTVDNSSISSNKTEIKAKKNLEEESKDSLDKETIKKEVGLEERQQECVSHSENVPEKKNNTESNNNIEKFKPTLTNTEEIKPTKVETSVESGVLKVSSVSEVVHLDSDEFSQLLVDEASRLAEELMNCSTDSGLPESRDSDDNTPLRVSKPITMADNTQVCDENVNPFQRRSKVNRSPPLGKRMSGIGSEAVEDDPFKPRHSLKIDSIPNERTESPSLDDDSGIALGSRFDLENHVNHSEAGPDIATGLTSSDLKCASQSDCDDGEFLDDTITDEEFQQSEAFFKEATDMENQLRKNLVSPMGSPPSYLGSSDTNSRNEKELKE
ncbi:unnamed protein product, partial [Meganyctiphanes norvegica]